MSPKQWVISIFATLYVYATLVMAWPWPDSEATKDRLLRPGIQTLDLLGLWHRLRLFAPVPPQATGNLEFQVTYDDGTTETWVSDRRQFAPGEKPDSYQRYWYYYVIWGWEQKTQALWPGLARYIARQCDRPRRHPVWVVFVENYAFIPLPGQPTPELDHHTVLMNYHVPTGKVTIGDGVLAVW